MFRFSRALLLPACLGVSVAVAIAVLRFQGVSGVAGSAELRNERRVADLSAERITARSLRRSGISIPDVVVTDERGRSLRLLSDIIRDRSVCVNFFYTRCDGSCPGTTRTIRSLRSELAQHFRAEELVFVSISLDPVADTAARLAEYRRSYGITDAGGQSEWIFVSCAESDLGAVRRGFGAYDLDSAVDAERNQHAATVTFGNARLDRWSALPAAMDRGQLLSAMCRIMGNSARQRYASLLLQRR
jgi:cytochrome oxidase Cu insertion factor (SCO1/SenC/PrrC family)